jgi:hypothetical protein
MGRVNAGGDISETCEVSGKSCNRKPDSTFLTETVPRRGPKFPLSIPCLFFSSPSPFCYPNSIASGSGRSLPGRGHKKPGNQGGRTRSEPRETESRTATTTRRPETASDADPGRGNVRWARKTNAVGGRRGRGPAPAVSKTRHVALPHHTPTHAAANQRKSFL